MVHHIHAKPGESLDLMMQKCMKLSSVSIFFSSCTICLFLKLPPWILFECGKHKIICYLYQYRSVTFVALNFQMYIIRYIHFLQHSSLEFWRIYLQTNLLISSVSIRIFQKLLIWLPQLWARHLDIHNIVSRHIGI